MAEVRKQLTETQAKFLADTQEALNKARLAFAEAEKNAQQVLTLIFDAHSIPADSGVRFDDEAKALVYDETDQSETPEIAGKIRPAK